jgi:adenylate cyclase
MDNRPTHTVWLKAGVAGAAMAVAALICLSPWGRAGDLLAYDTLFLLVGARPAPPELVVVAIDEPSFATLQRQWPWPRSLHAQLLDRLREDGAAVVALDMVFAEPSRPEEDAALARALALWERAVLAADVDVIRDPAYVHETVVMPMAALQARHTGVVNFPVDADGFVRRVRLRGARMPPLAAAAADLYRPGSVARADANTGAGALAIDYLGPARSVRTVSYYQALLPGHLPAGFFAGKLVFVGMASSSVVDAAAPAPDHFPTPFTRWGGGYMPGVEIHAQLAAALIEGRVLRSAAPGSALGIGLLAAGLLSVVFYRARPVWSALALLGWAGACAGVAVALLVHARVYVAIGPLVLPVALSYLGSTFVQYWLTRREKAFIRRAFASYVSPAVVRRLIEQPDRLRLGGEVITASVLFTDLAGFTPLSERLPPEALVEVLNRHLGAFSEVVLSHDGMVDKYVGDSVMAIWGAPLPSADHAARACRAAVDMRAAMAALDAELYPQWGVHLTVRVGINTGSMVAGNVGGRRAFNYTVLGNAVNLASRLESLNKVYGTVALIGEETCAAAGDTMVLREVDLVRVRGQERQVRIYELQGLRAEATAAQLARNRAYAEGLAPYRARRFAEAAAMFEKLLEEHRDDGPSQTMLARCRRYENQPPAADWDGIYTAAEK